MPSHDLKVRTRQETGKQAAARLRRSGFVPAVVYGHKEEPVKLAVDAHELRDLLAHHGSHGLLSLKFEDGSIADTAAVIKALQRHPVKHRIDAIDFLRVSLDENISATVPIVLEGEPIGVKQDGGILVQALHALDIVAFPQFLPENVTIDVTSLIMNGPPLHVGDIPLPEGVRAVTDAETPVAVVNPPRVEAEVTEEPTEGAEGEGAEGEGEAQGEEES